MNVTLNPIGRVAPFRETIADNECCKKSSPFWGALRSFFTRRIYNERLRIP